MAINPETQFVGKITPSSADYPYGEARNVSTPGDGRGTPWLAVLVNDLFGWQQALLGAAGIVPTGNPDKVGASQYLDAIVKMSGRKFDTVADMVADTTLNIGEIVHITGYPSIVGAGANTYQVVAAATGTADGGSFIDLATHQAKALFNTGWVDAKQFGATGDGVADDSAEITAAETYLASTIGGSLILSNGKYLNAPFPVSDNVTHVIQGPDARANAYSEENDTTFFSHHIIRGARQSAHPGEGHSLLSLESHPVGSTTNGPASADIGLTVSLIKHEFFTTAVQGELDGISVIIRQGGQAGGSGSDAASYLFNGVIVDGSGFISGLEGNLQNIQVGTGTVLEEMHVFGGSIDTITGLTVGFAAAAQTGALNDAFRAQEEGTSTWDTFFRGLTVSQEVIRITNQGYIVLTAESGATPVKVIRNALDRLSILANDGSTEIFTIIDSGSVAITGDYKGQRAILTTAARAVTAPEICFGNAVAATATAGAATLPANPVGFNTIYIGATQYKIPYYAA